MQSYFQIWFLSEYVLMGLCECVYACVLKPVH